MKKILMPLSVLLLAAIISAVLYFVRIEIFKDWQTTTGTVTNTEITHGKQRRWVINYYWSYTVDGVEYSGYDNFNYRKPSKNFSAGAQKKIYYNPENPSQSSFHKPGPDIYPYIPFIFAVPVMLAVYHTQAQKESKKL